MSVIVTHSNNWKNDDQDLSSYKNYTCFLRKEVFIGFVERRQKFCLFRKVQFISNWTFGQFLYSAKLRMFLPGCGCALPRSAWAWFLTGWARWSSCSWSGCLPCLKTRRQDWFDRLFLCLEENSFYRVLNILKIKIVLKSEFVLKFRASYHWV